MNPSLVRPLGYFEWGLQLGLLRPQDVADWAARRVAAVDNPDPDLCNLATVDACTTNQILERIGRLIPAQDRREILPLLFGRIGHDFSRGRIPLGKATHYLYLATVEAGVFEEDQYYEAYCFDDEYDIAKRGLGGDLDTIAQRVCRYLDAYAEYQEVLDDAV